MNAEFKFESLDEFMGYFHNEDVCRKHFAAMRFSKGEYCAHCKHNEIYKFSGGKRYRCAKCKQDFTIKTNTIFGQSKIPLRKWFIAIYLLTSCKKGISSVELADKVGVTQKTGWFIDHRIREALRQNGGQLFGTIEADETYIGGKSKNMHASKRKAAGIGTGGLGKAIIAGAVSREGQIRARVVQAVDSTNHSQDTTQRIFSDAVAQVAVSQQMTYNELIQKPK